MARTQILAPFMILPFETRKPLIEAHEGRARLQRTCTTAVSNHWLMHNALCLSHRAPKLSTVDRAMVGMEASECQPSPDHAVYVTPGTLQQPCLCPAAGRHVISQGAQPALEASAVCMCRRRH